MSVKLDGLNFIESLMKARGGASRWSGAQTRAATALNNSSPLRLLRQFVRYARVKRNASREPAVPDGDVGNGLPITAGVEVEFYQL